MTRTAILCVKKARVVLLTHPPRTAIFSQKDSLLDVTSISYDRSHGIFKPGKLCESTKEGNWSPLCVMSLIVAYINIGHIYQLPSLSFLL